MAVWFCNFWGNKIGSKAARKNFGEIDFRSRSYKTFFFVFFFFGVKLGHFTINYFILCVTNAKAYEQKAKKTLC